MKLLTKTTLYYLLFSFPLVLGSGAILYYNIQRSLVHEIDEELQNSKDLWIEHLNALPADKNIKELSSPFIMVEYATGLAKADAFSDTLMYSPLEKEMAPYRTLVTYVEKDKRFYRLAFSRSMMEKEDLYRSLIVLMSMVFGGLLLLFYLTNSYVNYNLWKPFKNSLEKIKDLNMQQLQQVHFDLTDIKEFNDLNQSLNAMTDKMNTDYLSIKTFTQNASHEIQTPLAIIQSKLELLLQDQQLSEEQADVISSASEAAHRLSKLNQALLTITKIGNRQFVATETVSLQTITQKYMSFFQELLEQKKIICTIEVAEDWVLLSHPILADMLISNLFTNAIRYADKNGTIRISITEDSWEITNTSQAPAIEDKNLFNRFYRKDTSVGNGLGLSIVKEICDSLGISIQYTHKDDLHRFYLFSSVKVVDG